MAGIRKQHGAHFAVGRKHAHNGHVYVNRLVWGGQHAGVCSVRIRAAPVDTQRAAADGVVQLAVLQIAHSFLQETRELLLKLGQPFVVKFAD